MKIYKTCRICKAVYFNKAWHHGENVKIGAIAKSRFAWTTRCPACKMVEKRQPHGLVVVSNVPPMANRELLYLIRQFAKQEYEKNCQRRLIETARQDHRTWRVTTTDKKMAEILANRISRAFDHVEVSTTDADENGKFYTKWFVEFLPIFYHKFNPGYGT